MQNEDHALREALGFGGTYDASLNLQGALDDLRGRFDPKDGGVIAGTIERVIMQIEKVRAALSATPTPAPEDRALREIIRLYVDSCDVRPEHQSLVDSCAALSATPTSAACPADGNLLSEDGVCGFCGNAPVAHAADQRRPQVSAPPVSSAPIDNEALVEEVKQAILAQGCGDDYTVGDAARAVLALPSIATRARSAPVQSALVEEATHTLAMTAGALVVATDGQEPIYPEREAVLDALTTLAKLKEGRA